MRRVAVMMGAVSFVIGAALLVVAADFAGSDSDLSAKGGRAEGRVTAIEGSRNINGKVMYRPHVAFTDTAGQRREFTSRLSSNPPGYTAGEAVAVIYDPANPADAEIDSFASRHLGTLVFGLFGAVFAMLGAVVVVRAVR
jgi:hypothetical protein